MILPLRERRRWMRRRSIWWCGEFNLVGVEKEMRFGDHLEETDEMANCKGRDKSLPLPCSARSLLGRFFLPLRPSRESSTPRSRLPAPCASSCEKKRDVNDLDVVSGGDSGNGSISQVWVDTENGGLELNSSNGGKRELALPFDGVCRQLKPVSKDLKGSEMSLTDGTAVCSKPPKVSALSGRFSEDASFNFGVGIGLAFLIAMSNNQINKMIELRTQTEMMLNDIKDEMRKKNVSSSSSETTTNLAHSASDSHEIKSTDNHLALQNHTSSRRFLGACISRECDRYSKCDATSDSEKSQGMDQLEVELEAELERLQLNLDSEYLSGLSQQKQMEMAIENTASERSFSAGLGEVDDNNQIHSGERNGVSPNELKRRLHELQETRQQERITELESALECTKQKLQEKELEICWWKETVQFISQHNVDGTCSSGKDRNVML